MFTGDLPDDEGAEEGVEGEKGGGEPFGVFGIGDEVNCLSVEVHGLGVTGNHD